MATITQNNVNFNNVPVGSNQINGWGTKYTNMNNVLYGKYDPDPENIEKSFNAIEIDWNGATVNNITLNNTGQLISIIKDLHSRISALESKLNNSGGSTPEATPSDTPSDTPSASPSASPSNTPSST